MSEPDSSAHDGQVHTAGVMSGILWTAAQRWGVRVATAATFVVLGRTLSPSEFGVVALATVLVSLFGVFAEVGLTTYLVQAREVSQRLISSVFWSALGLSVCLAAAVALIAPAAARVLDTPDLTAPLQVLASTIVLHALSGTQTGLLKRRLQFKGIAVRALLATVVSCTVAVSLALGGAGVWALVAQSVSYAVVTALVLWRVSEWRPSMCFAWSEARAALGYGSSILLLELLSVMKRRGDVLVVGVVAGPVTLGLYAVAARVSALVLDTVVSVISTVSTPVFARLRDDLPRLRRAYLTAVDTSAAVMAPVLLLVAATAEIGLPLLMGDTWADAVPALQYLAIGGLMSTLVYFDRGLMLALGRQRLELVLAALTVGVGLLLVAVAARYGLAAAAAAVALRGVLTWPVRLRVSCHQLGLPTVARFMSVLRIVLAGSLANIPAAVLVLRRDDDAGLAIPLVLAVGATALLYPPLLWVLNRAAARRLTDALGPLSRRAARRSRTWRPAPGDQPLNTEAVTSARVD